MSGEVLRVCPGSGEQLPKLLASMLAALLFGQASAEGAHFFQPPVAGFLSQGSMVSQAVPVPMVLFTRFLRNVEMRYAADFSFQSS